MTREPHDEHKGPSQGHHRGPVPIDENCQRRNNAISLTDSFRYAISGLGYALGSQRNARIHCIIAALVLMAGVLLRLSILELAVIVLVIGLVIIAELFNTVTEATIDLVTNEWHPLAKAAKDVAAGAVLVTAVMAVIVGLLVFWPHVAELLSGLRLPS